LMAKCATCAIGATSLKYKDLGIKYEQSLTDFAERRLAV